ncbi:MAG: hypothetical protein ACYTEO_18855 [Planctomycetota bacterium]|jgi:hypothetical protein
MLRNSASICVIAAVCLVGCGAPVETGGARRIDTPAGMIEYLRKQNPAVKSIEIWPNKYGDGLIITTEHYEIYTTLLEPLMLSQVPGFVESAYRSYQGQMPEPIETTTKFTVYLFANRQQWEDFTKTFAGRQAPLFCKIKAGAYYLNGACVAYNIGRERTFSVLGHEGWHQFNSRHFEFRLPSWLDEGVAMLFEVSRSEQGLFYFEPGRNVYRLGALKKTLETNKMIPLKELIAMNPGEVLAANQTEELTAFYGQSYALVRFLREEGYGKRLRDFHRLLLGGLRGDWPLNDIGKKIAADRNIPLTVRWNRAVGPLLFRYYIDDDFDEIEKEYIAFCRKIVYHVRLKTQDPRLKI